MKCFYCGHLYPLINPADEPKWVMCFECSEKWNSPYTKAEQSVDQAWEKNRWGL